MDLEAEDLANQLRCAKARNAVEELQRWLKDKAISTPDAVRRVFTDSGGTQVASEVNACCLRVPLSSVLTHSSSSIIRPYFFSL